MLLSVFVHIIKAADIFIAITFTNLGVAFANAVVMVILVQPDIQQRIPQKYPNSVKCLINFVAVILFWDVLFCLAVLIQLIDLVGWTGQYLNQQINWS